MRMVLSFVLLVCPALLQATVAEIWDEGVYEVKIAGLSCNTIPQPCYTDFCRVYVFGEGQSVDVVSLTSRDGKSWGYTAGDCWVRMSDEYLKTVGVDYYHPGHYRVQTRSLSCNVEPKPCYSESCRRHKFSKGLSKNNLDNLRSYRVVPFTTKFVS